MKIILWILTVAISAALLHFNYWNNPTINYWLGLIVILGGPFAGVLMLLRWFGERGMKDQPRCNKIQVLTDDEGYEPPMTRAATVSMLRPDARMLDAPGSSDNRPL